MSAPTNDPTNLEDEHGDERDPRNSEIGPDGSMPGEFVDTPQNQPGDQSPPPPETVDG